MDLGTQYLGLKLANPFIVGASPLVYKVDSVRTLEAAGAGAVVMHSLYEEQIVRENVRGLPKTGSSRNGLYPEASRFPLQPKSYLEHISRLKDAVSIPIIASLNGIHLGTWIEYARKMEEAGADALELNLYFTPHSHVDSSSEIERKTLEIVKAVRENLNLPLAVKINPFYTSLPTFVASLKEAGASSVVLFNSFFQTDIDIESVSYKPNMAIHEPHALLLRTRWIATLYGRCNIDLSLIGGINSPEDAIKGLMAGASTVQIVSFILNNGPTFLTALIDIIVEWMEMRGYQSIDQIRGLLSFRDIEDPEATARASYLHALQSWRPKD